MPGVYLGHLAAIPGVYLGHLAAMPGVYLGHLAAMPGVYLGHWAAMPGVFRSPGCYARGVFRSPGCSRLLCQGCIYRCGGLTDLHCSGLHSPDNSDCGVGEEHGGGGGVRCFLVRCP